MDKGGLSAHRRNRNCGWNPIKWVEEVGMWVTREIGDEGGSREKRKGQRNWLIDDFGLRWLSCLTLISVDWDVWFWQPTRNDFQVGSKLNGYHVLQITLQKFSPVLDDLDLPLDLYLTNRTIIRTVSFYFLIHFISIFVIIEKFILTSQSLFLLFAWTSP